MRTDFLGNPLHVGDKVAFVVVTGKALGRLKLGTVTKLTSCYVEIESETCDLLERRKTLGEKCVKIE